MARVIEPFVVDQFLERMQGVSAEAEEPAVDVDAARAERDAALAQRDAFLMLEIKDPRAAQAELNRRQERLDAAEAELASLSMPSDLDSAAISDAWPDLNTDEQREIMRAGIDAVFLRRAPRQGNWPIEDRVHIVWSGEGSDDLPGPGRRNLALVPFDW
jgi:hypothetical protein